MPEDGEVSSHLCASLKGVERFGTTQHPLLANSRCGYAAALRFQLSRLFLEKDENEGDAETLIY